MGAPRQSDTDVGTAAALRDRYAIVGIGETGYSRASGMTTRALAVHAIRAAMNDAGLEPGDVDGLLSHAVGDSTSSHLVAGDLGLRLNFYADTVGGGASVEALIGMAIGIIEAGMCRTVAIYRAMNGYTQTRTGGTGQKGNAAVLGDDIHTRAQGWSSPAQIFAPSFLRHMYEYGTRAEDVAMVRVAHSHHAARNPKALYPKPVTVEDVLASRLIATPIRLLDCCVETDSGTCIIVTDARRARDCRKPPVLVRAAAGRVCKPRSDMHYQAGDAATTAGAHAAPRLWAAAGLGPADVSLTAAYDAFTFTSLLLLEDYGFCRKGEGGPYVASGAIRLGGARPNNTSGGLLCEGYANGMNLVIENVRQLRDDADDNCPIGPDGRRQHTYDHGPGGGCRQVRGAAVAANLAWGNPGMGSALVLVRG